MNCIEGSSYAKMFILNSLPYCDSHLANIKLFDDRFSDTHRMSFTLYKSEEFEEFKIKHV